MLITADNAWTYTLKKILNEGATVTPRGMLTKEILQHTVRVSMRYPVLQNPARKLSRKFMAGEAFWILTGDNTVKGIKPYCKAISNFSDNGETFFGAYGPPIKDQLDYVVRTLELDKDSRQAVLTIWRQNPPKSRDIPCTVAIGFIIRNQVLHLSVFMRSSDAWLGLPYDIFNFSMLTYLVCARLRFTHAGLCPGILHLTMSSSHLYDHNMAGARKCLSTAVVHSQLEQAPSYLYCDEHKLFSTLDAIRHQNKEAYWWRLS